MTKQEAWAIFGLEEGANRQMIESRYARLIKGYHRSDPEKMAEINEAYRILTDSERKVVISPRMQKEVAGKSLYQWKNIVHYGTRPFLVGLAILALVVAIIYSVVTNEDPDFTLVAMGRFYNRESSILEDQDSLYTVNDFLEEHMELQNPMVDVLTIGSDEDPQMEVANVTKRVLYAGGMAPSDIMLFDQANFDSMEAEGILIDLEDFYLALQSKYSEEELSIFTPVYGRIALTDEEREIRDATRATSEDDVPESTDLYGDDADFLSDELYMIGLDVSETQLFNGLSLLGSEQILSINLHLEDTSLAFEFIERLIEEQDKILDLSPGMLTPSEETDSTASSN